MTRHVGVYPGTFDPVTNGHLDIIGRAARILDRLVVGVATNAGKGPLFPLEERVELVRAEADRIAARAMSLRTFSRGNHVWLSTDSSNRSKRRVHRSCARSSGASVRLPGQAETQTMISAPSRASARADSGKALS